MISISLDSNVVIYLALKALYILRCKMLGEQLRSNCFSRSSSVAERHLGKMEAEGPIPSSGSIIETPAKRELSTPFQL